MSLSALNRKSSSNLLDKLKKQVEDLKTGGGRQADDRFWQPTVDASGVGHAVIRFLPAKQDDDLPFIKTYRHSFQEGSSWFIDNCPSTIGQECPVCKANGALWNSGIDADKDVARKRKRSTTYVANILVIKDPGNSDNEGKVFMYKFGPRIFDKIQECLNADPEMGEDPVNPFSFFDGVNFNLKIANVAGYRNYDKSKFVNAGDLFDGDEDQLKEILGKVHDLNEFLKPEQFTAYAEMEARFLKVIGVSEPKASRHAVVEDEDDTPFEVEKPVKEVGVKASKPKVEATTEDDDDMSFFKSLAAGSAE